MVSIDLLAIVAKEILPAIHFSRCVLPRNPIFGKSPMEKWQQSQKAVALALGIL
jgi:hypothetical protein